MSTSKFNALIFVILMSLIFNAYANCPPHRTITIENDHFTAVTADGIWLDINRTDGSKLPIKRFEGASGIIERFRIIGSVECDYVTADHKYIGLIQDPGYWNKKFKIGKSSHWSNGYCRNPKNEIDCPFFAIY